MAGGGWWPARRLVGKCGGTRATTTTYIGTGERFPFEAKQGQRRSRTSTAAVAIRYGGRGRRPEATCDTPRRQARWGSEALVRVRGTHRSRFTPGGAQTPTQVGRRVAACAASRGDARSRARIWAQLPGQRAFDRCFLQKRIEQNFHQK
jgi:hypothetical protein